MSKTSWKVVSMVALACGAWLSFASTKPAATDDGNAVVIIFKDGHQQKFPMAAVARMEFRSAAGVASPISLPSAAVPGRGHFLGKWLVGDGNGSTFYITLEEDGHAAKSVGAQHGTWSYVDGEAHIAWDDGWHDAIRKVGGKHEKFAFAPGKQFTDSPSNVTEAKNTSPRPI